MQWEVHDCNAKAMRLYERVGGKYFKEWLSIRMDKANLARFAAEQADTTMSCSTKSR